MVGLYSKYVKKQWASYSGMNTNNITPVYSSANEQLSSQGIDKAWEKDREEMELQADNTQTGNSKEETRVAREEAASVEVKMEEGRVCGGRGRSSCGGR